MNVLTMSNLNKALTEAIDKLIPEAGLMELKPGCRVLRTKWKHNGCAPSKERVQVECIVSGTDGNGYWCSSGRSSHKCNKDELEILGIEPELRHVLWALEKAQPEASIEMHVYGGRMCFTIREADGHISPRWYDLTRSLYAQDEEVKEWLLNLLTQKQ